jgi:nitroreductase
MDLIKDLNWRYATKHMTDEMVPAEKLKSILDSINLTATSYGLQPFSVIVVSNKAMKQELQAAAYGQAQVGSCSHLIVFTIPLSIETKDIEAFVSNMATTRHIPLAALDDYKAMMMNTVGALPAEQQQVWSTKQAYIALGTAMTVAAQEKIDTCPMEGFDADAFDKILGLKAKKMKTVVILPIGFRTDDDPNSKMAKVRKPLKDMVEYVK